MKLLKLIKRHKINLLLGILIALSLIIVPRKIRAFFDQAYIEALQDSGINVTRWSDQVQQDSFKNLSKDMVGLYDESGVQISQGAAQALFALNANFYKAKPSITNEYLAYVNNRAGFVKKAYAQGEGWNFLSVILDFWIVMRNIAYMFFIVIFIIVGFMIMFRTKINPQTVMSIQTSLPKIVVALLLVTFSFAICGLLVDLVWLGNGIVAQVINPLLDKDPSFIVRELPPIDDSYTIFDHIFGWAGNIGVEQGEQAGAANLIGKVFSGVGDIIQGAFEDDSLPGFITFITAFIILSSVVKILFALVSRYVLIIVQTIFSPFIFLFSSLSNKGFGAFFKQFIASVLTFPATYAVLNLSSFFATKGVNKTLSALPPLVLSASGAQAGVQESLNQFFALGLLMAVPSIPQAIEKAFDVSSPLAGAGFGDLGGALRKIPIVGQLFS